MTSFDDIVARLRVPVMGAPLFMVSSEALVIAQCRSGIIGAFPALNARGTHAALHDWLSRIEDALGQDDMAAPFAVNQIVHRSNSRLAADVETCVRHRVPIVITSLGAQPHVNDAVHSYGGIVMHDVTNQLHAHKAIEKGADGLILVAAGAGGHAGVQSPFALLAETRAWFDGPIVLSGAIATGRAVLAAIVLGANLAYVGSAFIASEEANAVPDYKQMVINSEAADIVYTDMFTGVHGNYLRGSITRAGLDPEAIARAKPATLSLETSAKAWRDVWGSGQGIGAIDAIRPAAEIVARLADGYAQARAGL
ncbi:NAD(P)H-dependent flavin oxidoreductase [Lichenicola sp.]|uniref:NAD(P)H-dependent flavin oxidoreductase n=1 Tax=Lichenicola sp. TaxID=2804529 RepID=UPI003B009CA8